MSTETTTNASPPRLSLGPPRGITLQTFADPEGAAGDALCIIYRPPGGRRLVAGTGLLFVFGALAALLVLELETHWLGMWLFPITLLVLGAVWPLVPALFNQIETTVDSRRVRSRHRPFGVFHEHVSYRDEIAQLCVGTGRGRYQIYHVCKDGSASPIVQGLPTAAHAQFIEQAIEQALGLPDQAVQGEIRDPARPPPAGPVLPTTDVTDYRKTPLFAFLWWLGAFVVSLVLVIVSLYHAAANVPLGKLPLGPKEASLEIRLPADRVNMAFLVSAQVECRGPLCVDLSNRVRKLQFWRPPFDIVLSVVRGEEVLEQQRCDPTPHLVESSNRLLWESQEHPNTFAAKVKVLDCSFRVPEPGIHRLRAHLEPKPGSSVDGWNGFGEGDFASRVRFRQVTLWPGAYSSEAAARQSSE